MKPFEELTQRGRVLRYRKLAQAALAEYGISDFRLLFIRDAGNVTFRVNPLDQAIFKGENKRYYQNHCVLRIHEPGYQTTEAITSELEWLCALRRDTNLAVPEPVRTLSGALSVEVQVSGIPQPRRCSLLRWMKGRMLTQGLRPAHFHAAGRLMAGLHQHAAHWQRPKGFTRPRYDWQGLFGDNDFIKVPSGEVWTSIPEDLYGPFEIVTTRLKQVMDKFGQATEAFGLIHADIGIGANILFEAGEARAIDFDDCAFGYWMFDFGVALSDVYTADEFHIFRDALLEGYTEIRPMPEEQWVHLDLFIAAWHAFEMYWAAAGAIRFLGSSQAYSRWVSRAAKDMLRCMEGF
jgi:Ser/Thr protein kinase RdoA (MazF antagonist)